MKYLLTIVTITYNDASGLRRTANSLIPQLSSCIQWIIKDGGSTPSELDEIVSIVPPHLGQLISSHDSGVYDAMNQALSFVEGDWVIFMNGGDVFASPHVLVQLCNSIRNSLHDSSNPIILVGSTFWVMPNGKTILKPARPLKQCYGINSYRMPTCHQSQVYSSSICATQRFRTYLPVSADHAYFWDAVANGAFVFCLDYPIAKFYTGGLSSLCWFSSCVDVLYSILYIQKASTLIVLAAFLKRFLITLSSVISYRLFI